MTEAQLVQRLRVSGGLIVAGLLAQLLTYLSASPAAFLVFAFVGCGLAGLGIVAYLLLVARQSPALAPDAAPETGAPAAEASPRAASAPTEPPPPSE